MRTRSLPLVFVVAVGVVAFGVGLVLGGTGILGVHPAMLVGDGYVGDHVATLSSGGTAYGLRASVAWTDEGGSFHDSGWPSCLARPGAVSGVKFAGSLVWHEDSGIATVLWVDCS